MTEQERAYLSLKENQLGMCLTKARARLMKSLLFRMAVKAGENNCFRCGIPIENEENLTVDHKIPWLHEEDAKELFFNLDNIAFSHPKCNILAARLTTSYHDKTTKGINHHATKKPNKFGEWQCSRCKIYKLPIDFKKSTHAVSGIYSRCKVCDKGKSDKTNLARPKAKTKVTRELVEHIRNLKAEGKGAREIALLTGVGQTNVGEIIKGTTWK